MKKIVALILSVLMIFPLAVPAFALGDQITNTPTVYIRGAGRNLYESDDYESDDTIIYPFEIDINALVNEHFDPLTKVLMEGLLTGNYDNYCDYLYGIIAPIFEDVVLDENGEASNGTGDGIKVENIPVAYKTSGFKVMENDFRFDFRLSPLEIAKDLKIYIERVYAASGNKKIALVGRCFAGNIVSAYLAEYPEHAKQFVESVVMYIPSTSGIQMLGALFSGEIVLDPNEVDSFAQYLLENKDLIEDPTINAFVSALVAFLNHVKVLGLGTDAIQNIVEAVKGNLVPRLALATFGTFPGYWAMIPTEYYESAKATIFAGQEEKYAGLIAKNDEYFNKVQLTYEEDLVNIHNEGVSVSVIAKYNIPGIPVYEGAKNQSDLMSEATDVSLGATFAPYGKVLPQSYIDSLEDTKYVSPDRIVDASTCLFPDRTWFFKDMSHYDFPDSANALIAEIINGKGTLTVFSNENYPQYMQYDPATEEVSPILKPVTEKPEEGSNEERFSIFVRFFTAIINFFTKLFNGELF